MTLRPPASTLELADIIRRHGRALIGLTTSQRRVLNDLAACRTVALGGHVLTCDHCRHQHMAYNSCRNRHCPKCSTSACARWMEARARELLPVPYFHVVFTLPDLFNPLALANPRILYKVLFTATAQTLLQVAANPRHLGARIGFMAILHTWGQNLTLHPHLHCVVPGGGLSPMGDRWVACRPSFFLPVRVLSRVFRGKFLDLLRQSHRGEGLRGVANDAALEQLIHEAARQDWVVYAKPPFGGPAQVLKYLARYTHRIAISNRRLVAMDDQNVTFRWKDYAHHQRQRTMTLAGPEFLRRFLLHRVPEGFVRIRHFGLLANRQRRQHLAHCRHLLQVPIQNQRPLAKPTESSGTHDVPKALGDPKDRRLCPTCGLGHLIREWMLSPWPRNRRGIIFNDTS